MLGDGSDDHFRQQATCWVDGIDPIPFHDVHGSGHYPWGKKLEESVDIIDEELKAYQENLGGKKQLQQSNNIQLLCHDLAQEKGQWLGSRNEGAGQTYGPQWQTLGLMDRGLW